MGAIRVDNVEPIWPPELTELVDAANRYGQLKKSLGPWAPEVEGARTMLCVAASHFEHLQKQKKERPE